MKTQNEAQRCTLKDPCHLETPTGTQAFFQNILSAALSFLHFYSCWGKVAIPVSTLPSDIYHELDRAPTYSH